MQVYGELSIRLAICSYVMYILFRVATSKNWCQAQITYTAGVCYGLFLS